MIEDERLLILLTGDLNAVMSKEESLVSRDQETMCASVRM